MFSSRIWKILLYFLLALMLLLRNLIGSIMIRVFTIIRFGASLIYFSLLWFFLLLQCENSYLFFSFFILQCYKISSPQILLSLILFFPSAIFIINTSFCIPCPSISLSYLPSHLSLQFSEWFPTIYFFNS